MDDDAEDSEVEQAFLEGFYRDQFKRFDAIGERVIREQLAAGKIPVDQEDAAFQWLNLRTKKVQAQRLAAILVSDVAKFSAAMRDDQQGTIARYRALRDEIIKPVVNAHGGRVFNEAGDSVLAEFPSAVSAVQAALEIQNRTAVTNLPAATDKQIHLRIGLHVGEVVPDGTNLLGHAVDVAARLQDKASTDGIVASEAVRVLSAQRIPKVAFQDLGILDLKNIGQEQAYAVQWHNEASGTTPSAQRAQAAREGFVEMVEHLGRHYKKGEDGKPTGRPYCPVCLHEGRQMLLEYHPIARAGMHCPRCKSHFERAPRFK